MPEPQPDVEIWWLDRNDIAGAVDLGWLSPSEIERRGRFVQQADRDRFALGRALCRAVLSQRLGRPPRDIVFEIDANGRPILRGGGAPSFSLSHSGDVVAAAFAPWPQVGVDTEREDRAIDLDSVSATVFTVGERAALAEAVGEAKVALFFALWTLKEAYLKATGLGFGLDARDCAFDPRALPKVHRLAGAGPGECGSWRFHQWRLRPGYPLALAVRPPARAPLRIAPPRRAEPLLGRLSRSDRFARRAGAPPRFWKPPEPVDRTRFRDLHPFRVEW